VTASTGVSGVTKFAEGAVERPQLLTPPVRYVLIEGHLE
jgi:hypothetical protein